ncbi:hypothetical protein VHEMI05167 [[Torrubiella] hemipterigena]|uniref:protein-tyrosine-phosphatase n=1 Tax=[Torrubiella] hemipterigena TaxID=1531966 RepID=A0A0A1TI19_9HYPO|nr:hypothetical protein VHEMI05167 [[Torrubiella] hemipterigena]
MPSAAARQVYEDQIPTFMSVFDLLTDPMVDCDAVTLVNPKMADLSAKAPAIAHPSTHGHIHTDHKHHNSNSSELSASTDSSPTTISTTDSSPLTDGSPSSSPDSPIHLIPLHSYPGSSFDGTTIVTSPIAALPEPSSTFQRPMTSPAPRRPRNMKNLSIQPPSSSGSQVQTTDPGTPAFIKPTIPGMRRKPSLLSLNTNTTGLLGGPKLAVPASPALPPILQRRALKHSTSSPHMLARVVTTSSDIPPMPKMLERNESGLSDFLRPMKTGTEDSFDNTIHEEPASIKTQVANFTEYEPYDERVNNEDQKSPTYPNGPVAIYGDNVFLYLEPTAAEASKFDVVFNVAREVQDPFEQPSKTPSHFPADVSPVPDTAATDCTFATALEYQASPTDSSVETPTTPRAIPLQKPEYIHMDWDHNTDISPDLMELCEKIDARTKQGKRVLIHCQQGASRSASLIIAYGLFQNPALSVNDAYYAAQAKSKWISPNMKLMYSLQDFQKEVSRKLSPPTAYRPRTGRSPTKHRLTLSADAIPMDPKEPKTAPLPTCNESSGARQLDESPTRPRGNSTPDMPIAPGPASAPLTSSWRELSTPEEEVPEVLAEASPAPNVIPPEPQRPAPPIPFIPIHVGESLPRPKSGFGQSQPSSMADMLSKAQASEPRPRSSLGFRSLPLRSIQEQPSAPIGAEAMRKPSPFTSHVVTRTIAMPVPTFPDMSDLMSPRAETMTTKPLWATHEPSLARFIESPPTPTVGLFSPRLGGFPKDPFSLVMRPPPVADPRSPPTRGEAQITRSIDNLI